MGDNARAPDAWLTVSLCFVAALFEGIDLQSMGIAAPKLIPEFHLTPAQFGTAASMSLGGLLVGAVIGGRLADRVGRKRILIGSLALLGVFSLITTLVATYDQLLCIRFLVGLGLGGAFPTLIALVSENWPGRGRSLPISLMYAGIPVGTIIGSLMVLHYGAAFQWRWFFYIGGFGPLLILPLLAWKLPESRSFRAVVAHEAAPTRMPIPDVLFGGGRAVPTVLLWFAFFFTLSVIYLLTNWLNQLMAGRGLSHVQATLVLLGFGCGSVIGSLALGALSDAGFRRASAIVAYLGVSAGLAGMALLTQYPWLIVASVITGFFAVGVQLVNYALAPQFYAAPIRGTGVGWTVAIGRVGSWSGPQAAGLLLTAGFTASQVLLMFVPGLLLAAMASVFLLWRPAPG